MTSDRYRLYLDESGVSSTSHKSLKQDPYLALVGVAFEVEYYQSTFQPALEEFKKRHLPYDPDDPPVLHKYEIIHKKGSFRCLRDTHKQAKFDQDLLHLVCEANFCLFAVVVNKQANVNRYGTRSPEQYCYALAGMIPRYVGYLHYVVRNAVGDVMAEARYPSADRELSRAYRDIYENGTVNYPGPKPLEGQTIQRNLTTRNLKLKRKRNNIAGLQLADLLTYCCKIDVLREYGEQQAGALGAFSENILAAVQSKYNRNAYRGTVRGYGKILIQPG